MTTQTPTAPASEAANKWCECDPHTWIEVPKPICSKFVDDGDECGMCGNCEHDEACHTTNRADPGP